jgi:aspartate aminotransferase-like enzyme
MVSPRVYQALAQPVVGHLDPFFFEVIEDIRQFLKPAFLDTERLQYRRFRYRQLGDGIGTRQLHRAR